MFALFGGEKAPPGFMIDNGNMGEEYWPRILKSIFCLATSGGGWGSRFKVGMSGKLEF
jgi:hypothetical protein